MPWPKQLIAFKTDQKVENYKGDRLKSLSPFLFLYHNLNDLFLSFTDLTRFSLSIRRAIRDKLILGDSPEQGSPLMSRWLNLQSQF